jgi:heterodisulfide reductase subunit A-like polyferredoxin
VISSPFIAKLDAEICVGCETCLERCQMEALSVVDEHAVLKEDRCIGCGLCVSTCQSGALTLERKRPDAQLEIPKNQMDALKQRINARTQAANLADSTPRPIHS